MLTTGNIDDFRKFVKDNNLRCMEVNDVLNKGIYFYFKTKGDKEHFCMVFNENDTLGMSFSKAYTVQGSFDVVYGYLSAALLAGQCKYINHYRGDNVVDLSR